MKKAILRKALPPIAVLMLVLLLAVPMVLASPDATATRTLPTPATVAPSTNFVVDIAASGFDTDGDGFWMGQVIETLPPGFTYVTSSYPLVEVAGNLVTFNFMGAGADTATFDYTVTASAIEGDYTFTGLVLDEDKTEVVIGGDTAIKVEVPTANQAPAAPSAPSPADGATGVSTSPTLSVLVTDPDGDAMDVTFYDASDDSVIGTVAGVASGNRAGVTWPGLASGTGYDWYAKAYDGELNSPESTHWSFTTSEKLYPAFSDWLNWWIV